ncbi:hypothetical protein I41_16160 [Lacipirellula limnantheis]|uniref:Uncharacterized protein n=1 Tax=Lacipirellula limnantheis TaxID=2528024 RepID=A0A517TVN9_9BACT|nr:hypothetical protein I41_16160 [Lacipirellula limnantheis]
MSGSAGHLTGEAGVCETEDGLRSEKDVAR